MPGAALHASAQCSQQDTVHHPQWPRSPLSLNGASSKDSSTTLYPSPHSRGRKKALRKASTGWPVSHLDSYKSYVAQMLCGQAAVTDPEKVEQRRLRRRLTNRQSVLRVQARHEAHLAALQEQVHI